MGFFRDNFTKMPVDVQRKGLGRWFEILEERFMNLFWVNLVTILCLLPSIVCFLIAVSMHDIRLWVVGMVCFVLAGPAVTALHSICMRIVLRIHYWLWEDYRKCMKREWKSSMLLSALIVVLWSALACAVYLVMAVENGVPLSLFLMFVLYAYLLMGFTVFSYQQLAMVDLPFTGIVRNAVLLIFAGGMRSAAAIFLAMGCAVLCYLYSFWAGIVVLLGGFAIIVMTMGLIVSDLFKKSLIDEE